MPDALHSPRVPVAPLPRLYFLDWVRILAFFLLIVYHVGMYYVTWGWMVKSPHASPAPEPFMMLSSPWRLSLLFLVSGVASGSMLARATPCSFVRQRRRRLLPPLIFGILVIVPPQPYLEVVEKLGYGGGYLAFMRLYLSAYHGFCQDGCLILPTWNHLWFVAYLWVYTLLLALLVWALGPRWDRLAAGIARWMTGWRIVALPAAALALVRVLLVERFAQTHALVDDWYAHAYYLVPFLLGALLAPAPQVWPRVAALRWTALPLALFCWAVLEIWWSLPHGALDGTPWALLRYPAYALYALLTWSAILAACGFAQRHLDRDGPARRYLAEAVFPVYILHQTIIAVLAHAMKPLQLAPGFEALLLIVLTTTLSLAGFEAVRRVAILRPLFGLERRRAQAPAQDVLAPQSA
jgi:peptidoglycan/LPS O-acetylase OafA/YrhL